MKLDLEEEIESIRKKLVDLAEVEGITSKSTIEMSRQLDELLNKYQQKVIQRSSTVIHKNQM